MNLIQFQVVMICYPMFEFEQKGGMDELRKMEGELLDYLGFNRKEDGTTTSGDYDDVCKTYGLNVETDELENEHEERLGQDLVNMAKGL